MIQQKIGKSWSLRGESTFPDLDGVVGLPKAASELCPDEDQNQNNQQN